MPAVTARACPTERTAVPQRPLPAEQKCGAGCGRSHGARGMGQSAGFGSPKPHASGAQQRDAFFQLRVTDWSVQVNGSLQVVPHCEVGGVLFLIQSVARDLRLFSLMYYFMAH